MRRRLFRWLLPACLLLSLTACGTQFLYNRLDSYIVWELEDYVDLSDEQEAWLESRIAVHWAWHRREALPRYADWLTRLAREVQQPLTLTTLQARFTEAEQFYDEILRRLLPDIEQFLAGLSDAQIEALFAELEEENQEFSEEYVAVSTEKLLKMREKRTSKSLRQWLGHLNEPQLQRLKEWAAGAHSSVAERLAFRRYWQAELRTALNYRHDQARFAARIKTLFLDDRSLRSPEFAAKSAHNLATFQRLLADESRLLDAGQRQHLRDELLDYAEDFRALSTQSP